MIEIVFLGLLSLGAEPHEPPSGYSQTVDRDPATRRLVARRATGPILVDGVLDEDDWEQAPVASHFIQREPMEGAPATYDTEVRVLYDADGIYVGVLAFDDEPENLVVTDLKRDFNTSAVDTFAVILDTFHDRRNAYVFSTNPGGAKYDSQSFNEGQSSDANWDGVWYVKSRVVEAGWTAEIMIPFKTVKFRRVEDQTWGVNFLRRNRRLNEDSFWSPIPRIHRGTRVSLAGTLEQLERVEPGASFKLTPYARGDIGEAAESGTRSDVTGGLDAKIGVGTGLTLDLTLNTDFSEVEADVQQVNLTRFSLFFPEKRDFFLENSGIFRFGPPENQRRQQFRRSFGLAASNLGGGQSRGDDLLLFFSRRIGLSEDGEAIPVIGGGRFTGRLGPYELGFMNIQTGREEGISPGDNFTVARVKRNIFRNSDFGAIFINRDTMDSSHYNRSFGADANIRLSSRMDLNGYVAKTSTPGLEGDDLAGRIAYTYNGPLVAFESSYSSLGNNFNPEVGFAPRLGIHRGSGRLEYRYRQSWARHVLREIAPTAEIDYFTNQEGVVVSRYFNLRLTFRLQNGGFFNFGRSSNLEQLDEPFEIHPTTTIEPGFYPFTDYFVTAFSDPSKTLSATLRSSTGTFYSGTKHAVSLGGTLKLAPRFTAEIGWAYNDITLEEGSFATHLLSTRFNYAFSTNMFLNALIQYNSIDEEWTGNIRFNLIHRPLSDLFVVYNDLRDQSGQVIDRQLVTKFTYLFDF